MIALVPPGWSAVVTTSKLFLDITQPEEPVPVQSAVKLQKKKSVPVAPIFLLKNSVTGEHRALVDVRSWADEEALAFRILPENPKKYRHGVMSDAPVPHKKRPPVPGALK